MEVLNHYIVFLKLILHRVIANWNLNKNLTKKVQKHKKIQKHTKKNHCPNIFLI